MNKIEIKLVAADMRRDHPEEHPRHEMWLAIATLLDNVTCALNCDDDGMRWPHCSRCDDSTDDHDCPDRVPCSHGRTFKQAQDVAIAYKEAKA